MYYPEERLPRLIRLPTAVRASPPLVFTYPFGKQWRRFSEFFIVTQSRFIGFGLPPSCVSGWPGQLGVVGVGSGGYAEVWGAYRGLGAMVDCVQ